LRQFLHVPIRDAGDFEMVKETLGNKLKPGSSLDTGTGAGRIKIQPQRSAEEAVTEALRNAIHQGHLKPGQKLSQADLAEQLGVSRIPLRDALRRLESEALVTMNGRRGTWVSALSVETIREMYEIRIMLEGRCTRYAIAKMNDEDLAEILALLDDMDEAESNPENRGFSTRRTFYARFYECADRPLMRDQILLLRDNVSRYHRVKDHNHAHDDHIKFRQALVARDADSAEQILTRHLEEARDDLLMYMETVQESSD
jgi:DNA-binding GntR family transcriptional regulator